MKIMCCDIQEMDNGTRVTSFFVYKPEGLRETIETVSDLM